MVSFLLICEFIKSFYGILKECQEPFGELVFRSHIQTESIDTQH